MWIVHPVVLTVHDVVTHFHIVQNFSAAKHDDADHPEDPVVKTSDHSQPANKIHTALDTYNFTDVIRVFLTHFGHDVVADFIQIFME